MKTRKAATLLHYVKQATIMANLKLRRLYARLRRRPATTPPSPAASSPTIRLATFNAAAFSAAPAVPPSLSSPTPSPKTPKSILKQKSFSKSKRRVSINLPENEISLLRDKAPASSVQSRRSVLEVLRGVGADILSLQNVRADEENAMSPLSELARALGMSFVFAESWAPQYGNAVLSRFPIRRWSVQKISQDSDFRNVLKVTVEVPRVGEVTVHCTHLDHLSEIWRLTQIRSILRSSEGPHILTGGLNALDETDYSMERWRDIVKFHEEMGKPPPKAEVMKFLREKGYVDAKDFVGECEAVVVLAKGQDVQGTCKYGTRVDYILGSPDLPFEFVPGSYSVFSSEGTSDHHIVKVDIRRCMTPTQKIVRMDARFPKGGVWAIDS